MRRIHTTSLPDIVEAELETKEYWFEKFRRAIIAHASRDCIFVSIDLYREEPCSGEQVGGCEAVENNSVSIDDVSLQYCYYNQLDDLALGGVKPEKAWLVRLETRAGCEIIGAQAVYCGIENEPSYSQVYSLYRRLVGIVENRDPEKEPLQPPPVKTEHILERIGLRTAYSREKQARKLEEA